MTTDAATQLIEAGEALCELAGAPDESSIVAALARRGEAVERLHAAQARDSILLAKAIEAGETARRALAIRRENLRRDLAELREIRRRRDRLRAPDRAGELVDARA